MPHVPPVVAPMKLPGLLASPRRFGWFPQLLTVTFLLQTAMLAIRPAATYRVLSLGGGPVAVGLAASSYAIISLFAAVPIGRAMDRRSANHFLMAGGLIIGGAATIAAFSSSILFICATQAILGLGQILLALASQTIVAQRAPDRKRDVRIGHYTFAASLGQFCGPLLVSAMLASPGSIAPASTPSVSALDNLFLAIVAVAVIAVGFTAAIGRTGTPHPAPPARSASTGFLRLLSLPALRQALLTSAVLLTVNDVLIAYLPLYGTERRLPVLTVGILLASMAGASMLGRLLIGRFSAWRGRTFALLVALWAPAAATMVLPIVPLPLAIASLVVIGLGMGIGQPLTLISVVTSAPREARGAALGLRIAGNRLGQLCAPAAAGLVAESFGVASTFWLLGALLAAAGLLVRRIGVPDDAPAPSDPALDPQSRRRPESPAAALIQLEAGERIE